MKTFSLRQLEFFVAVASTGTLRGGAAQCNASQAAVSLAITQLEQGLNTQLLIRRHAKGVALTASGSRVLIEARALLSGAEELVQLAHSEGRELKGAVRVGCFTPFMPFVAPLILDDLARLYPAMQLSVLDGSAEDLRERLLSGELDLAVLHGKGMGPGLDATGAWHFRPYVIVAAGHPLASRQSIALAEIADEPLVTLRIQTTAHNSEQLLLGLGLAPRAGPQVPDLDTIRSLVARGLGYSIIMQPMQTDLSPEGRRFVSLRITDDIEESTFSIVTAQGISPTRRVAVIRKRLTEWPMPSLPRV